MSKPLFTGSEWTFDKIETTWEAIDKLGTEMGFDYYVPQIEVISTEQMLDSYSSVAMPVMYKHWSFGKSFIQNEKAYAKGQMGLAYEVVINTNPILTYLMEDNTMTMQCLVMAHAVCGHGSFFKNNYLFKEWTDADSILDYLQFAKDYVSDCEQKYGRRAVERTLDACHTIQHYGVDKYKRPPRLKKELKEQRRKDRLAYTEKTLYPLYNTLPDARRRDERLQLKLRDWNDRQDERTDVTQWGRGFPEENLLYFIEKKSPVLKTWQREIVRIVRKTSQYFYPQMQTQLMNEGWATFTHYEIMTELNKRGQITDGSYIEFLKSHSGVVNQPLFNDKYYSGINVYALGFAMFRDLKRIITEPTKEDKKWFPDIAGKQDYMTILKEVVENYRDESFVLQYLSPKVIRDFQLFTLSDFQKEKNYVVKQIHDDDGVYYIRGALSKQYSLSQKMPQIEVTGVDWNTDRALNLRHIVQDGKLLSYKSAKKTTEYIRYLWGMDVSLDYVDMDGRIIDEVEPE